MTTRRPQHLERRGILGTLVASSLGERIGVQGDVGKAASRSESVAAASFHWTVFFGGTFGLEIAELRSLVIRALLVLVRDMIALSAPQMLRPEIANVVDGFTQNLVRQLMVNPMPSFFGSPPEQ